MGRKGDEQLLALWEAARGAQALLAVQASLVLRGAGTQRHNKTCVTLGDAVNKENMANRVDHWRELLRWQGRMQDMMGNNTDAACNAILELFSTALCRRGFNSTGTKDDSLAIVRLETRRVDVLGKIQHFRDQDEVPADPAKLPTSS